MDACFWICVHVHVQEDGKTRILDAVISAVQVAAHVRKQVMFPCTNMVQITVDGEVVAEDTANAGMWTWTFPTVAHAKMFKLMLKCAGL